MEHGIKLWRRVGALNSSPQFIVDLADAVVSALIVMIIILNVGRARDDADHDLDSDDHDNNVSGGGAGH